MTNSAPGVTPATSIQYGYIAYLRGLPIFTGDSQSEKTALVTFYVQTTTTRVIGNGPMKLISREGAMTIYRDPSANGNFSSPDSFRGRNDFDLSALGARVRLVRRLGDTPFREPRTFWAPQAT